MADTKVSGLTEDTSPASGDYVATVDVSDTTMAATGTDKKVTLSNLGTLVLAGTAAKATILATARTFQTNLASTSTASFDGSANVTPGVTGTLPLGNGGTGGTTAATAAANLAVEVGKLLFPIGAIYAATVSTNPATLLGFGTWSAYGAGKVMVGKAGSGTFATGGATGGEETHTLTASESGLPAHTHGVNVGGSGSNITGNATNYLMNNTGVNPQINTGAVNNNSTASASSAHNNLQPYIVTYLWERTA